MLGLAIGGFLFLVISVGGGVVGYSYSNPSPQSLETARNNFNTKRRQILDNIDTNNAPLHSTSLKKNISAKNIIEKEDENSAIMTKKEYENHRLSTSIFSSSTIPSVISPTLEYENKNDYILENPKFNTKLIPLLPEFTTKHINIGIIGKSGSGKSSFINTYLDHKFQGDKYAKADVIQAQGVNKEIEYYDYFGKNTLRIWDLPGYSTTQIPTSSYLKDFGLEYFDIIILITSERFTQDDNQIIKDLNSKELPIPTFVVRNKIDIDFKNYQEDIKGEDAKISEEEVIELQTSYVNKIIKDYHKSCPDYINIPKKYQNLYFLSKKKKECLYNWVNFEQDILNAIFDSRKMTIEKRKSFNNKIDEIKSNLASLR